MAALRLGTPAITTPKVLELRPLQDAISNTRQRIEALERALTAVAAQAGQTAYAGTGGASNATIAALQVQIATLTTTVNSLQATIDALLALDDGYVTITSGVLGSTAVASGDDVLYDDTGRALLTGDGRAILIGA